MSSTPSTSVFRSAVFKLIIVSSVSFVLVILFIIWLLGALALNTEEQRQKDQLLAEQAWIEELYKQQGAQAIARELADGGPIFMSEDKYQSRLKKGELIYQIQLASGTIIGGYPSLKATSGWSLLPIDIDGQTRQLVVHKATSKLGDHLILGKIRAQGYDGIKQLRRISTFFLLIIAFPLAIVTGYFVSRKVFKRLQTISNTAEAVGQGEFEQRLTISKKSDEFDRLSSSINDMLDNLQDLQRNIESVSVGIAHDLKTPLTQLDARLQMIKQDIDSADKVEKHADAARRSVNKILTTFSALLRLGEIEAGKRKTDFAQFNLSSLALDIAESYEPVFADVGKSLDISILPNIKINGDQDLFAQLIINLLENIIEHSQQGAEAWIRLQLNQHGAVLQIGDDGPGIPEQHRDRIFERFYRVDQSRSKQGNGLGLSLVKSICNLHDAQIVLLTQQSGTVFDIYISVN